MKFVLHLGSFFLIALLNSVNISYLSRAVTKIACSWLLVGGELNK